MSWTDRNGNVGLRWNMLKKLLGAGLHAVHVGDGMFTVHVVHYVEVAHFILRGTTADKTERQCEPEGLIHQSLSTKRQMIFV